MGGGWSVEQIPSLEGQVAIITGANTGIGKETALQLAKKGAHVILACRSKEKGEAAVEWIKSETKTKKVRFMQLDLCSLDSICIFAQNFRSLNFPLNMLINNAGIMGAPFALTTDGYESHFGVNYIGHFYLTLLLIDILERNTPSRIVNLSSIAHSYSYSSGIDFKSLHPSKDYDPNSKYTSLLAYGQSKLANILFTNKLSRLYRSKRIYINSVHPGFVSTDLFNSFQGVTGSLLSSASLVFAKSPEKGALNTLFAATSTDVENKNLRGRYFTPVGSETSSSSHGRSEKLADMLWEWTLKSLKSKNVKNIDGFLAMIQVEGGKKIEEVEEKNEEEEEEEEKEEKEDKGSRKVEEMKEELEDQKQTGSGKEKSVVTLDPQDEAPLVSTLNSNT